MANVVTLDTLIRCMEQIKDKALKSHVVLIGRPGNGKVATIQATRNGIKLEIIYPREMFDRPDDIRAVDAALRGEGEAGFYPILIMPKGAIERTLREQFEKAVSE